MEQTNQTLGKRIAALRKEKGMTQEQLAEKVGVSAQAVSKWENDASCPDITLLPLLGDILGVSVDELRGVKPIEPHVIIIDKDESAPARSSGSKKFHWEWDAGKWPTIAVCIGLILVCLVFLLRGFTPLFPDYESKEITLGAWSYIWPLLVFTFGLISVRSGVLFGSALMAVGGYEFVRRMLIPRGTSLPGVPWYVIVLVIAIALLVRTIVREIRPHGGRNATVRFDRSPVMNVLQENDFLEAELGFGSGTIVYDSERFTGGTVEMNFGEYVIDLTNVKTFTQNCVLKVDQSFGRLTVIVPKSVRIVKSADMKFASNSASGEPDPNAAQTLIMESDVNFGALQIEYR
jgi:transcriptional regulator with XRE-family HTH domain/predicted membrane protein